MRKFTLTKTALDNGEVTYHTKDQEIVFRKLTLLIGDNNSGKTSMMHAYLWHHENDCSYLQKRLSHYNDVFEDKKQMLKDGIEKPIVAIEQPELELSESNQFLIGQEIVSYVNKGHQILVETHSEQILYAVRLAIKNKVIDTSDVSVIYLGKEIFNIEILPNGKLDAWPDGFFDASFKRAVELI